MTYDAYTNRRTVDLVPGAGRSQVVGTKMLPHIAAEFLRSLRKLSPGFLAVRRGDQEANADSNSQAGNELQHAPKRVVPIVAVKGRRRASDTVGRCLVGILCPLTKIVKLIADSLSETLFRTIRLVKKEQ